MRIVLPPAMRPEGEPVFAAGAHYRSNILFVEPAPGGAETYHVRIESWPQDQRSIWLENTGSFPTPTTVTDVAATPPIDTEVTPVRFVPVIVIGVPPAIGPAFGVTLEIAGTAK